MNTHATAIRTICIALLAGVSLASLTACVSTRSQAREREAELAAQASALNTVCPVTGGTARTDIVSTHRNQRVAFASPAAQQQWNEMDDEQRDVALARVSRR